MITRLAVLDVSEESHGNIVGIGFADLTTERLVAQMDPEPFRINVLTSCFLERARIPITLPTDRDVIEAALDTCWRIDPTTARMVVIPNTLELKTLWVSPASRGRGPRPSPPDPRDRVSSHSTFTRRRARSGCDVPPQHSRVAGKTESFVDSKEQCAERRTLSGPCASPLCGGSTVCGGSSGAYLCLGSDSEPAGGIGFGYSLGPRSGLIRTAASGLGGG